MSKPIWELSELSPSQVVLFLRKGLATVDDLWNVFETENHKVDSWDRTDLLKSLRAIDLKRAYPLLERRILNKTWSSAEELQVASLFDLLSISPYTMLNIPKMGARKVQSLGSKLEEYGLLLRPFQIDPVVPHIHREILILAESRKSVSQTAELLDVAPDAVRDVRSKYMRTMRRISSRYNIGHWRLQMEQLR